MLRVTKSGGSVSLVVWSKSEVNPFSYLVTRAVALYVDSSQPSLNTSDAFCFAEPGLLANLLRKAGANDTRERILHFDITAPISPEEFWTMRSETSGTLRQKLEKLSAADRQTVGHSVLQAVRDFFPNNHMKFPAQMLIVTGKKPEVLP
jgi:hypothetical protein